MLFGDGGEAGEEDKVGLGEGLGIDFLDEGGFVADGGYLAGGLFLIVEQDEVGGGEERVVELVGELFAGEGGGAGDGDAVHAFGHSCVL